MTIDLIFCSSEWGSLVQERWIQENLTDLDVNVVFPSGATLDYIAGAKRMAPRLDGQALFGMGISPGDGAAKTRIPLPGGTVGSSKSGSGE